MYLMNKDYVDVCVCVYLYNITINLKYWMKLINMTNDQREGPLGLENKDLTVIWLPFCVSFVPCVMMKVRENKSNKTSTDDANKRNDEFRWHDKYFVF